MSDTTNIGHFREPMETASIASRLDGAGEPYALACLAAGHQSAFTVDKLARKLRQRLPTIIAEMAAEVEAENDDALTGHGTKMPEGLVIEFLTKTVWVTPLGKIYGPITLSDGWTIRHAANKEQR